MNLVHLVTDSVFINAIKQRIFVSINKLPTKMQTETYANVIQNLVKGKDFIDLCKLVVSHLLPGSIPFNVGGPYDGANDLALYNPTVRSLPYQIQITDQTFVYGRKNSTLESKVVNDIDKAKKNYQDELALPILHFFCSSKLSESFCKKMQKCGRDRLITLHIWDPTRIAGLISESIEIKNFIFSKVPRPENIEFTPTQEMFLDWWTFSPQAQKTKQLILDQCILTGLYSSNSTSWQFNIDFLLDKIKDIFPQVSAGDIVKRLNSFGQDVLNNKKSQDYLALTNEKRAEMDLIAEERNVSSFIFYKNLENSLGFKPNSQVISDISGELINFFKENAQVVYVDSSSQPSTDLAKLTQKLSNRLRIPIEETQTINIIKGCIDSDYIMRHVYPHIILENSQRTEIIIGEDFAEKAKIVLDTRPVLCLLSLLFFPDLEIEDIQFRTVKNLISLIESKKLKNKIVISELHLHEVATQIQEAMIWEDLFGPRNLASGNYLYGAFSKFNITQGVTLFDHLKQKAIVNDKNYFSNDAIIKLKNKIKNYLYDYDFKFFERVDPRDEAFSLFLEFLGRRNQDRGSYVVQNDISVINYLHREIEISKKKPIFITYDYRLIKWYNEYTSSRSPDARIICLSPYQFVERFNVIHGKVNTTDFVLNALQMLQVGKESHRVLEEAVFTLVKIFGLGTTTGPARDFINHLADKLSIDEDEEFSKINPAYGKQEDQAQIVSEFIEAMKYAVNKAEGRTGNDIERILTNDKSGNQFITDLINLFQDIEKRALDPQNDRATFVDRFNDIISKSAADL